MSDELYSPPSYQWYPADFYEDTRHLSFEERAAYSELLDHQWKHGCAPPRDRIANVLGISQARAVALWNAIKDRFPSDERGLPVNRRMERNREEQHLFYERQATRGQRGARARWKGATELPPDDAYANAQAILKQCSSISPANAQALPKQSVSNGLRTPYSVLRNSPSGECAPTPRDFGDLEPDVATHIALAAAENKSGKLSGGRAIGMRAALGAVLDECLDRDAFAAGLREANAKGVGNANYVRQCVRSVMERAGLQAIPKRRAAQNDAAAVYGRFGPEPDA